jgi:hypothetical protein
MPHLGDFQTPPALVAAVLERLGPVGARWPRVLEPTCGRGHFLAGLLALDPPPREILGVEIQAGHLEAARIVARGAPASVRVGLTEASLFAIDLGRALGWEGEGPLLVVGNPPWVTNAALGVLESGNRPPRTNFKRARGLDAKTGASNFDIAEAVWVKLLAELADQEPTIALLCKHSVARNVLEHLARTGIAVARASVVRVDARAWFGASVEACLLCITLGPRADASSLALARIPVFHALDARQPRSMMGFVRGRLVDDLDAYSPFACADGTCPLVWRQGLKHDAADAMELSIDPAGQLWNKRGEPADIEPGHVFPLLKGTDLSRPAPIVAGRAVIVTQRSIGDDTARLREQAPRLWSYLQARREAFARRKSSIYRGRPEFAMFGVGPYCFAPYKVAVSGLHPSPRFHAVGPTRIGDAAPRPVMLDDTGYFLACHWPEQAALAAALLNGPEAIGLLGALAPAGAKRPVTKGLLQRIDLPFLLARADRPALLAAAGAEVERLAGRPPVWREPLEQSLEPGNDHQSFGEASL